MLAVSIPLFVYLLTLAPTVTFFDSGEFITAIHSLGSAHSPGYPLFINYAKPFTYLPFGNIAFRVNIATAFSSAVACYGVYLLVIKLLAETELAVENSAADGIKRTIALSAALIFAFSARLWLQSNHDKPYPLVSFIAAMVYYLLLLWRENYGKGNNSPSYIYLGSFLTGLAFGAHQTIILLIPSYLYLIITRDSRLWLRFKEILLAVTATVIGFSIHLYLPLRATRAPLLNWGDPDTLTQFLWHFLRRGYPVEKPDRGLPLVYEQINAFNIPHEFSWMGLALLLIGLCAFFRDRRDEIISYLIGITVFLLAIVGYLNTPEETIFLTEEFFTPIYLFSAVFIGIGLFYLLKSALEMAASKGVYSIDWRTLTMLIAIPLPLMLCAAHYRDNDQHENYIAHDYAVNSLRSLPEKAAYYTWGDSGAFPLWYIQGVEKLREDISLLHVPHLYFQWYLDSFPELFSHSLLRSADLRGRSAEEVLTMAVSEQMDFRPVYVDFSTRYSLRLSGFSLNQHGICYRLEKGGEGVPMPPDLAVWDLYSVRGVEGDLFLTDLDTGKAILIYAYSRMEGGGTLLSLGRRAEGLRQLLIAEMIVPALRQQIDGILKKHDIDGIGDR